MKLSYEMPFSKSIHVEVDDLLDIIDDDADLPGVVTEDAIRAALHRYILENIAEDPPDFRVHGEEELITRVLKVHERRKQGG